MPLPAMHSRPLRFVSPRRFGWLLWFALLLPVAQAAAACHAFSHLRDAPTSEPDKGKQAAQPSHCDRCLMAAAIGGGAPLADAQSFTHPALRHDLPQADGSDVWLAPPVRAYRSRAPPRVSL
jgi:hypothetical protein